MKVILVAFAKAVRERGTGTPWCIDLLWLHEGTLKTVASIGPAQGYGGGIVCAEVRP